MIRFKQLGQSGLGHVVGLSLVVVAFAVIGYIGFKLYANPRYNDKNVSQQYSQSQAAKELDATAAPQIKKLSDLDSAQSVLDQVDPGSANASDDRQLDSQLDSF